MEQIWTNPFIGVSKTPYNLIAAGEGGRNIKFPDGTITSCVEIKRKLGYPQLFAWNSERKALLEFVEYLREHPECKSKLVVDSGAYSMWSKGKTFDMDEYIDFLHTNEIIDTAFWVAEADVIPGSFGVDPTPEEVAEAPEKSWQNYLYMIQRVKWPKKIVPIFHMGEDYKHLKRMLEYKLPDGEHIPYIGISPRNDVHVAEKIKWYERVWKIISESSNPNVLTHNFGMTTISLMEQYPSMSSDSTSWLRTAAFGRVIIVNNSKIKTVYMSNRNTLTDEHINYQNPEVRRVIEETCKEIGHGLTLDSLSDDDTCNCREIFNLYTLDKWRKSFIYEGNTLFKQELW